MDLHHAKYLAEGIKARLIPVCERVVVAGSIRRNKKECHDIDIVVLPYRVAVNDLFGASPTMRVHPEFARLVDSWEKIKGDPHGKYCQRRYEGVKLEISIASKENFGCITMIRTGDADFSHLMMKRVRKCGLEQRDGFLWNYDNKIVPVYEEEDYFKILGLPYVKPEARNADAFKRAVPA